MALITANRPLAGSPPGEPWTGGFNRRSVPDPVVSPAASTQASTQRSFDELGEPLRDITFVVVDLETTGGSSLTEEITEIGAVKVRGGEVLGDW